MASGLQQQILEFIEGFRNEHRAASDVFLEISDAFRDSNRAKVQELFGREILRLLSLPHFAGTVSDASRYPSSSSLTATSRVLGGLSLRIQLVEAVLLLG